MRSSLIKQSKTDSIFKSFTWSPKFIYLIYNFSGNVFVLFASNHIGFYNPSITNRSMFLSNVAENNNVYLLSFFVYSIIKEISYKNPISKSQSASSSTKNLISLNYIYLLFFIMSINLPGVAIITWGYYNSLSYCSSILNFPTNKHDFNLVNLLKVWNISLH